MNFEVLIFPLAQADLSDTREYYEKIFKTPSMRVFEKILDGIAQLEQNPLIYPLLKDPTLREKGYRFVPIDNFLLFFVVLEDQVQIRRFLYGGRNYASIL